MVGPPLAVPEAGFTEAGWIVVPAGLGCVGGGAIAIAIDVASDVGVDLGGHERARSADPLTAAVGGVEEQRAQEHADEGGRDGADPDPEAALVTLGVTDEGEHGS